MTNIECRSAPTRKAKTLCPAGPGAAIRRAIRSVGVKLFFLPKYSPDLNPIEQVFAKLKYLLCTAAARTFDAIITAIGPLLDRYAPA